MEYDEYKDKLFELREKYPDWEENEKAWDYGREIWSVADKYVEATYRDDIISKDKKVKEGDGIISRDEKADKVFDELQRIGLLKFFLTDNFRKRVIRYHVRNKSTTAAVVSILNREDMKKITPFYLFKYENVCGYENIKKFLVARLSYLKPSNERWPRKKYGAYWEEARQEYVDSIGDTPLSHGNEQFQELSELYQHLKDAFESTDNVSEKERLSVCMMRVMAGIHQMTKDPIVDAATTQELTEEDTKVLPTLNEDNILDIPVEDVIVEEKR